MSVNENHTCLKLLAKAERYKVTSKSLDRGIEFLTKLSFLDQRIGEEKKLKIDYSQHNIRKKNSNFTDRKS